MLVIATLLCILLRTSRDAAAADAVRGDGVAEGHTVCGITQLQGRRMEMEDRAACHCPMAGHPDLCFMGVFDGHEGYRASQLLTDTLHERVASILLKHQRPYTEENIKNALDEGLLLVDKDFLKAAEASNWSDGSTAVVAIVFRNERVILGNVGNSRGIICRKSPSCGELKRMAQTEMLESLISLKTEDHTPGRHDERERITSSGNRAEKVRGKWRLNGELELSRAIGDFAYRTQGLISTPEFFGWLNLHMENSFLILASDGVFEAMPDESSICEIAEATRLRCKYWKQSPPPDPPIALGGIVAKSGLSTDASNPQETGKVEKNNFGDLPPGLQNCIDCNLRGNGNRDGVDARSTLQNTISQRIALEAFNRGSMDNIAVAVLDLEHFGSASNRNTEGKKKRGC